MGFIFRKRIRLFDGFYLNIGKRGIGVSAGGRGFRFGKGNKGDYFSLGIPGTGLFFKKFLKRKSK